jgi:hypothetical protein
MKRIDIYKDNILHPDMNAQDIFDAIGQIRRFERSDYHITLGELLDYFRDLEDKSIPVVLDYDESISVGSADSYRGIYRDLALSPDKNYHTVSDVVKELEISINRYFDGYKGGVFYMDKDTPLWISEYDSYLGRALVSVTKAGNRIILGTTIVDKKFIDLHIDESSIDQ